MDKSGLDDLLTVKSLAPKASWIDAQLPSRSAFSLPSGNIAHVLPLRSSSKEAIARSRTSGLEVRPPLPSLASLPRRILPRRSVSLECEVDRREARTPLEYADPLPGSVPAWGEAESPPAEGPTAIISLPGDAFSFAEAVDSPEDALSEHSVSEDDIIELEDLPEALEVEGDDEEERALETEADVEEGDDLDFAKDSDSDQPGSTQEDLGQCEGATDAEGGEPAPLADGHDTGLEEVLVMDGTEPVIIVKKKKKKKKKKRKKKHKLIVEEVTVEKKPAVPRFPHPTAKDEVSPPTDKTREVTSEHIPLRERFSKHLLLGRFPKRRNNARSAGEPVEASEADDEATKDPAKEEDTDSPTEVSAEADPGRPRRALPSTSAVAQRAARQRARAMRPPRVVRIKRILKEPLVRQESEKSEDGEAKAASASPPRALGALVAKAIPLRREPPPKTVWKEPVVETILSLGSLYFSFSSMRTEEGKKVPLKNRDKVVRTLHELNTKVALPICRQFGLRYNFFSEHHPQAKKAGVTCKEPLILRKQGPDGTEIQETRYLVTIRLRLRVHPTKGDPQTDFISHGTQIAVLLHELCHLKHMNHGKDFMLSLRDIFVFAHKTLGVFQAGESNEIPSPWPWENLIFQRAGDVSDDELLKLFAEHREKQSHQAESRVKTPPLPEEPSPKEEAEPRVKTPPFEPEDPSPNKEAEPRVKTPPFAPEDPSPKEEVPRQDADVGHAVEDLQEVPEALDVEAVSTAASDEPVSTPPRRKAEKKGGALLDLRGAFSKGHAAGCDCCDPDNFPTQMAYGEETADTSSNEYLSGEDLPPPPPSLPTSPAAKRGLRLPPLAQRSPPVASPKPRAPPNRLPPIS